MKKVLYILLLLMVFAVPMVAEDFTQVTAPEAPFTFEPLQMYVFPDKDYPITKYGAKQGNVQATTNAFAKAMAACNKNGGGRVVVPPGVWNTGPIHFKSNCNLYISEGAKIVFDDDLHLYYPAVKTSWEGTECMNISPLIYAYECKNIAISGPGMLAPEMDFWRTWFEKSDSHLEATRRLYAMCSTQVPVEQRRMDAPGVQMRPHLIHLNRCENVQLDGFRIYESPFWTIHTFMCKDVWVHHLDVYAHGHNNDGIDLEMTQHVVVEDCTFNQGDDGVVIKAGRNHDGWHLGMPSQDIVIRNCEIINAHSVLGIGSEMSGGVRRVYMHNCNSSSEVYRLFYIKTNHRRGGFIDNVTVQNVSASKMMRVFEIDTDVMYQWRDIVPTFDTVYTKISNIAIIDAKADQADAIYEIKGDDNSPIENITIKNIHVGEVNQFINNVVNVRNLTVDNVRWDNFTLKDREINVPGIAPGR